MMPVREAKGEIFERLGGEEKRTQLFSEDEVPRAEAIAKALEGLSIASAQNLLQKVSVYLMQNILT